MPVFAGLIYIISTAIFSILAIVVAIRLLALSRRTQQIPERSVGLSIGLAAGLGYGTLIFGLVGRRAAGWDDAPEFYTWIIGAGWIFHNLGVSFMLDFVRRVFRPGEAWAGVLQVGLTSLLWGAWTIDVMDGGLVAARPGFYYWLCFSVIGTYPLWTAIEALHYWSMMRRRVSLGLADPLVANRFLLWAIASLCTMASIWTVEIPTFLGYERLSLGAVHITTVTMIGTSVLGIITICTYWLTFFPPDWYRARFRASDPSEASS